MNNAYGPSDTLIAIGIFFFSLAMLQGRFSRPVAHLGIVTLAASVVGALLKPVLGAAYLWWWVLLVVWLAAVGLQLLRMGHSGEADSHLSPPRG